jgi:hypothetical protein
MHTDHSSAAARGEKSWTLVTLRDALERYEEMLTASELGRSTRFHYVDHAGRFLDWVEGKYAPRVRRRDKPQGWRFGVESRSKYDPLFHYLIGKQEVAVHLSFRRIEEILGTKLPASARQYHFWWANDTTGNHSQAQAWLRADRRVTLLDLIEQRVVFVRAERDPRGGRIRFRPTLEDAAERDALKDRVLELDDDDLAEDF